MEQKKIVSILGVMLLLFMMTSAVVIATGPKAVYGMVYINQGEGYEIAGPDVTVKIIIDDEIFETVTTLDDGSGITYCISIPPGYEGKTGYFIVGDGWTPDDNKTVFITTKTGYHIDLHVNGSSDNPETPGAVNSPPRKPSQPSPGDNETDVSVSTSLTWVGGDPDEDPVTYDIYFGVTHPLPKIASNYSGTTYSFPELLEYETHYYWKIVAWDSHGSSNTGSEWEFTTMKEMVNGLRGDMYCDGKLNSADVRYLARHINGDAGYEVLCDDGDINCDGQIDSADVEHLARYLIGDASFSTLYPTC